MSVLRKRVSRADGSPPHGGLAEDSASRKRYPGLCEFLGTDVYPDGESRELGSLTIYLGEGKWKGCLNDRDQEASLHATGETPEAVLAALEKLLHKEDADWRPWQKKALPRRK